MTTTAPNGNANTEISPCSSSNADGNTYHIPPVFKPSGLFRRRRNDPEKGNNDLQHFVALRVNSRTRLGRRMDTADQPTMCSPFATR